MTNLKSQIADIKSRLEAVYPADEAEALAWWIAEEITGLNRTQLQFGCKGTTNFPKVQEFFAKNDLCLHKNNILAGNACRSQENANVASGELCNKAESEGTTNFADMQEIIERLLHFEPIQYIFGHTLWNGLDLKVNPSTLIPRPETAELVERINQKSKIINLKSKIHVLDVGTGSGCIAIALKKAHPEWQVTGIDISPEAIETAKENARRNNVDVHFEVADIFSDQMTKYLNKWYMVNDPMVNIVVSNPPYICEKEKSGMRRNVLDYEPASALFVPDNDPLRFYRRIAKLFSSTHYTSHITPLYLFFEINEAYPAELSAMLGGLGYTDIHLTHDIYGKPRIIEARMA